MTIFFCSQVIVFIACFKSTFTNGILPSQSSKLSQSSPFHDEIRYFTRRELNFFRSKDDDSTQQMSQVESDVGTEKCPGGHFCKNFGRCSKVFGTDDFECDCTIGLDMALQVGGSSTKNNFSLSGSHCEHVRSISSSSSPTASCEFGVSKSKRSYCANGGTCRGFIISSTGQSHKGCKCADGYYGPNCESESSQSSPIYKPTAKPVPQWSHLEKLGESACSDGKVCLNYGTCVLNDNGVSYDCDCDTSRLSHSDRIVAHAGLYCEHAATSYCEYGVLTSKTSFCTNNGECLGQVKSGQERHKGCACPDGSFGPHCEYDRPQVLPSDSPSALPILEAPGFNPNSKELLPPGEEVCADGHVCKNFGSCVSNGDNRGSYEYYCDCGGVVVSLGTEYSFSSTFEGRSCEIRDMSYCEFGVDISEISFCRNGGMCKEIINSGQRHKGCNCVEQFEGLHCEYETHHAQTFATNGSTKSPSMNNVDQNKSSSSSTLAFVLISGCCAIVLSLGIFAVKKKRHKHIIIQPPVIDEEQSLIVEEENIDFETGFADSEKDEVTCWENEQYNTKTPASFSLSSSFANKWKDRAAQLKRGKDIGEPRETSREKKKSTTKWTGMLKEGRTKHNMGVLYLNTGQLDKADEALNDALRVRKMIYGIDHPFIGQTHEKLAEVEAQRGNYDTARHHFTAALRNAERRLGAKSLEAIRLRVIVDEWVEAVRSMDDEDMRPAQMESHREQMQSAVKNWREAVDDLKIEEEEGDDMAIEEEDDDMNLSLQRYSNRDSTQSSKSLRSENSELQRKKNVSLTEEDGSEGNGYSSSLLNNESELYLRELSSYSSNKLLNVGNFSVGHGKYT